MSFYAMTFGNYKIDHAFWGKTKKKAIESAREEINKWPEYQDYTDEEILELLDADEILDFDLVKIPEKMPDNELAVIALYQKYFSGDVGRKKD